MNSAIRGKAGTRNQASSRHTLQSPAFGQRSQLPRSTDTSCLLLAHAEAWEQLSQAPPSVCPPVQWDSNRRGGRRVSERAPCTQLFAGLN